MDDYLQAHPEYTLADFEQIKALSDQMHQNDYDNDTMYSRYKSSLDFDDATALIAAEDNDPCSIVIQREQRKIAVRATLRLLRSNKISQKQKRRFVAYFLHGRTISEIANTEKINRKTAWKAINSLKTALSYATN